MPMITDNVYNSNVMFFRLVNQNKKMVQGGLHIEVPINFTRFAAGGFYQGFDLLDISPSDTVKNAAFDWKQAYVPVSVDGLTLIRADSPEAVVNFLSFYFENAQTELCEILGNGVWNDAVSNAKSIDGLRGAIDDGTVAATYGGLVRAANTWWNSQVDIAAGPLTLARLRTNMGNATQGGRHPTLIASTQANYNIYWALVQPDQRFPAQPGGHSEQLASAGFTNLLFDGVPWVVDSHIAANHIFGITEDYVHLIVNPRADMNMKEFREPVNQDAMSSLILWAGNIVLSNTARHFKMTNIAS